MARIYFEEMICCLQILRLMKGCAKQSHKMSGIKSNFKIMIFTQKLIMQKPLKLTTSK